MPTFTWTSGQTVTAAQMNSYTNNCSASIYRTSALAIANASDVVVTWSTSEFDTDTCWAAGSNDRLTIKTAGIYVVSATIAWASNGTGERISWIQKNGSSSDRWGMVRQGAWSTGETMYNVVSIMSLVVNDYVQVGVYQASGGNLNLNGSGTARTRFGIARVSAAS